jgi:hypothetical protein
MVRVANSGDCDTSPTSLLCQTLKRGTSHDRAKPLHAINFQERRRSPMRATFGSRVNERALDACQETGKAL